MQINLINLDRSPERLAEFTRINGFLPQIRRVQAIEGRSVDLPALIAAGVFAADIPWTPGAIGNALSHLKLWDEAIATRKALTVCEDDAVFNRHFTTAARSLLHALPAGWDYMLWGWNFDVYTAFELVRGAGNCIAHLDQKTLAAGLGEYQKQRFAPQPFRLIRAFGAPCYTISPKGAAALKQLCLPFRASQIALPEVEGGVIARGWDVQLCQSFPMLDAYLCFPPLVVTPNDPALSTILPLH